MWHASVRSRRLDCSTDELLDRALLALSGVGDVVAGQWVDRGMSRTVHVRRRVLDVELVNDLRDIRRTPEAAKRLVAAGCSFGVSIGEI